MTTLNEVGTFEDFKSLVSSSAESFNEDDLKEIEDLSKQIKSIHADTFFTKSLRLQDKKRSHRWKKLRLNPPLTCWKSTY